MPTLRLLPELEDALRHIQGVRAASVVTGPDAVPTEVHVLADPGKPAKQVVRDVQSLAMARYDIDRDGQIDSFELRKALEEERRNPWNRANELFSTHPPTYKRILMLEQMEEEILRGGLPTNIYRYV